MSNDRLPLARLPHTLQPDGAANVAERFSGEELGQIKYDIGRRLVEAFDTDNLTVIANSLKTTPTVVREYVEGRRFPAPEMQLQFYRSTGISIHWLMTGKGAKRVEFKNVFTPEEEAEIQQLANASGRTFWEEVKLLAVAGAGFKKKVG
jgi:hypothetical protein